MPGCCRRSDRSEEGVTFFRIPSIRSRSEEEHELSKKRQAGYLGAIKKDLSGYDLSQVRICSRHFISGRPAYFNDTLSPDWVPSQNLSATSSSNEIVCGQQKYARYLRKKNRASKRPLSSSISMDANSSVIEGICTDPEVVREESTSAVSSPFPNVATQTEGIGVTELREELNCAYEINRKLKDQVNSLAPFTESSFQTQSKEFILHYTGLPNFEVVKTIFDFVSRDCKFGNTKLTPFQEYLLTLIKLRQNLLSQDLAYRFGINASTVSRILLKWLVIMDVKLKPLIVWPEREQLWKTMPECFREEFGNKVAVVLDCFELFIERPSNLLARACTWSTCKHHNTVKFLIGIAPQGVISFVSPAWGGRASDKYVTEHCGILSKLLPGDVVLADRGFNIEDSVSAFQAQLHIPAFTKGKSQLSTLEVEETRAIANVRIHVERVIGYVRQKFSILRETVPIDFVTVRNGEDCPLIDR